MSIAELRERLQELTQALEFALDANNQPVHEFRGARSVDVTQARIAALRSDIKALDAEIDALSAKQPAVPT